MNKLVLFPLFLLGFSIHDFAQKDLSDFLRNYKAPDFRYRSLNANTAFQGNGFISAADGRFQNRLGLQLGYNHFINSTGYQGILYSYFDELLTYTKDTAVTRFSQNASLRNYMNNRFYFENGVYIGFHDNSVIYQGYSNVNGIDVSNSGFDIEPAVSIGLGRVEWVQSARQVMDIERLLFRCGRMNSSLNAEQRKLLADRIAHLNTRRFYDVRLGRMYQLESLDSLLTAQGMVLENDFRYFSALQDAFLYSAYTYRQSGFRQEFGVTQRLNVDLQGGVRMQSFAFYNLEYYLPVSYAVQHDFRLSALGGSSSPQTNLGGDFPVWLDAVYTLGYYPTTRTYLGAGFFGGLNYNTTLGFISGTRLNAYYYISPKLRLLLDGQIRFGENYSTHNFGHVVIENIGKGEKSVDYGLSLRLLYQIF